MSAGSSFTIAIRSIPHGKAGGLILRHGGGAANQGNFPLGMMGLQRGTVPGMLHRLP
jgi:hypothetical protein